MPKAEELPAHVHTDGTEACADCPEGDEVAAAIPYPALPYRLELTIEAGDRGTMAEALEAAVDWLAGVRADTSANSWCGGPTMTTRVSIEHTPPTEPTEEATDG